MKREKKPRREGVTEAEQCEAMVKIEALKSEVAAKLAEAMDIADEFGIAFIVRIASVKNMYCPLDPTFNGLEGTPVTEEDPLYVPGADCDVTPGGWQHSMC